MFYRQCHPFMSKHNNTHIIIVTLLVTTLLGNVKKALKLRTSFHEPFPGFLNTPLSLHSRSTPSKRVHLIKTDLKQLTPHHLQSRNNKLLLSYLRCYKLIRKTHILGAGWKRRKKRPPAGREISLPLHATV